MSPLDNFIADLYHFIVGKGPADDHSLIKIHTRSLEDLGDFSFPLSSKNWYHLIGPNDEFLSEHIFSYKLREDNIHVGLQRVAEELTKNIFKIQKYKILKGSAHFFLERSILFSYVIEKVLGETDLYGKCCLFETPIEVAHSMNSQVNEVNVNNVDLTTLRMLIVKDVANNLLQLTSPCFHGASNPITISVSVKDGSPSNILCGPVINENGIKDLSSIASDFFDKRTADMRMMAQHRYRVNIKPESEWKKYFSSLGTASVIIELLSNKPHKPIKISLNDLSGSNKGPAFIFYNCARLCALLKEFKNKVDTNVYPPLPELNQIDLTLLNQKEEWELLYVYILQYPLLIKNCIKDIEKGIFNPQYLISFASKLSSVFSIYYRRVRILINPREHLLGKIYSRIYLLKAVQHIFHNTLRILNINPIENM